MIVSDTTSLPLQTLFPELQQAVLFPELVGASFLPLDQSSREIALPGDQQEERTRSGSSIPLEGQLTLWA